MLKKVNSLLICHDDQRVVVNVTMVVFKCFLCGGGAVLDFRLLVPEIVQFPLISEEGADVSLQVLDDQVLFLFNRLLDLVSEGSDGERLPA